MRPHRNMRPFAYQKECVVMILKRMFIVTLVAVLVVGLAVPASAVVSSPYFELLITPEQTLYYFLNDAEVDKYISTGLTAYGLGSRSKYPYYMLFLEREPSGYGVGYMYYAYFLISSKPIVSAGDVCFITRAQVDQTNLLWFNPMCYAYRYYRGISSNYFKFSQTATDASSKWQNIISGYYYEDYSTARFDGMYENEELAKNIVGTINTYGLETALSNAKSVVNDNYTAASWQALQAAIQEAETLLSSGSYTQEAVDGMLGRLNSAMSALVVAIDTSRLVSLISTAKAIQNDNYTDESWSALQNAIRSSQDILDYGGYTQASVDAMVNNLQKYINGLKKNAVVNPPYVFPEVPPMRPDAEGHRYLRDGIRFADLIPAQDAIMENVEWAISNGKILFGVLLLIYLTPRILRAAVGFDFESKYVDLNYPSNKSRHYRPLPKLKEEPGEDKF